MKTNGQNIIIPVFLLLFVFLGQVGCSSNSDDVENKILLALDHFKKNRPPEYFSLTYCQQIINTLKFHQDRKRIFLCCFSDHFQVRSLALFVLIGEDFTLREKRVEIESV